MCILMHKSPSDIKKTQLTLRRRHCLSVGGGPGVGGRQLSAGTENEVTHGLLSESDYPRAGTQERVNDETSFSD